MDMRAMFPASGNPAPRSRMGWRGRLTAAGVAGALALTAAHTLLYRAAERRLRQDLAAAGLVQEPLTIRHLGWSRSEVSLTLGGDARSEPVLILDRLEVSGGLADVLRPDAASPGRRDVTLLAATLTVPAVALSGWSGDGRFIWEAPLLRLNVLPLRSLSFADARVRVMAAPLLGRRFDLRLTGQLQRREPTAGGASPVLAPILAGAVAVSVPMDGGGRSGSGNEAAPMSDLDLGTLEVRAEPGNLLLQLAGAGVTGKLAIREAAAGAADVGGCGLDVVVDDLAALRPDLRGVRLPHGALHVVWRRDGVREQGVEADFTSRDTIAVPGGAAPALVRARLAGREHRGRGWAGDGSVDLRGPLSLTAVDGHPLLSLGAGNVWVSVRDGDWVRPDQDGPPPLTVRYDLSGGTVGPWAFTRLMAGDSRLALSFADGRGDDGTGVSWTLWPDHGALLEMAGWRLSLAPGAGTVLSGWSGGDGAAVGTAAWRVDGTGALSMDGSVVTRPDARIRPLRLRADRFALRRDVRGGLALSLTGLVPEPSLLAGIIAPGALPPVSLALTARRREGDGALAIAGTLGPPTLGPPRSAPPLPSPLPPLLTIAGTLGVDARRADVDVTTPEPAEEGRLSGGAHFHWSGEVDRGGWRGEAVVTAKQVALSDAGLGAGGENEGGWAVDGLDGTLTLASLFPLRPAASAQHFSAHRLTLGGMRIDDPAVDVLAGDHLADDRGDWRLASGRGSWAGGVVSLRPGGGLPGTVALEARGVRLSRLLPGLMAAGYGPDAILAGDLSLNVGPVRDGEGDSESEAGGIIATGTLAAPAGTVLRQEAGAPPAFDPRRNRDVALLGAALRNMTFDRLAVRIAGSPGAPRLRLAGHGVNPDFYGGYPVDIDVDVSDLSGGPAGAAASSGP